jgi:hypothetical protein
VVEDPSAESLDELRKYCASVNFAPQSAWTAPLREAARAASGAPRMTGTFHSPGLARVFRRVLATRSIDRILVSSLHVAEAARAVRDVPKAIDLVDVYSQLWLDISRTQRQPIAWLSAIEGRRLAHYEARLAQEFDRVILASTGEAELFRATSPTVPSRSSATASISTTFTHRRATRHRRLPRSSSRGGWTTHRTWMRCASSARRCSPNCASAIPASCSRSSGAIRRARYARSRTSPACRSRVRSPT